MWKDERKEQSLGEFGQDSAATADETIRTSRKSLQSYLK